MTDETAFSGAAAGAWARLASRRVYFGHQSVGRNIVTGLESLTRRAAGPRIAGEESLAGREPGLFVHGEVGVNGDPRGKTRAFAERVASARALDFALHKYCYVDIGAATDVEALFRDYRAAMERLRADHPHVTIVHVTTPLQVARPTWKAVVGQVLGRPPARFADNAARERFNDRMRSVYGGREPLFDLAAVESTRGDGVREVVRLGAARGYALVPAYASDGSHLNDEGGRRVAAALIECLAGLPARGK